MVASGLIEHEGQLLLVQNQRRNGSCDWTTPGGVIEVGDGESVVDGLTREVAEETGIRVSAWTGPVYEVEAVAEGLGWTLRAEIHRAVPWEGQLLIDDPDGIVIDARFVPFVAALEYLEGCVPWVREPLGAWLVERWEARTGVPLPVGWDHAGIDHRGEGLSASTRPEATILHVDMDAFYAAVEVLEDPSLAGLPVIVGGAGRRGVVAAASYEARAYGIRSAMPSVQAQRLCPRAVFVSGHHDRYGEYSRRIHQIFEFYTPLVQGLALDEAFLDVTGGRRLFGSAAEIGAEIRRRIADEVGLSASVGVATTMFVAKLASEAAKPTASLAGVIPGPGVVVVAPGDELAFLHPKPMRALWGVGPATAHVLERLGVTTIGELAQSRRHRWRRRWVWPPGRHLHELAWGRDEREVEPNRDVKSVGHEETYAHDRHDHADLRPEVVRMADAVATRLRAGGLAGRTVTLKVRFGDFVDHHPFPDHARPAEQRAGDRGGRRRPARPGRRRPRCPLARRVGVRPVPGCRSPALPRPRPRRRELRDRGTGRTRPPRPRMYPTIRRGSTRPRRSIGSGAVSVPARSARPPCSVTRACRSSEPATANGGLTPSADRGVQNQR